MKEARAMTELRAIAGGAGAVRRKEFHDQSGGAIVIAFVMKDQFDTWLRPRAERGERTAKKLLNGLYGSEIDLREGATHKCLFCDDRCSKDNPPGATVLIQPDNEEAPPALGCGYFVCRACAQPRDDLKDRVLARFRTPGPAPASPTLGPPGSSPPKARRAFRFWDCSARLRRRHAVGVPARSRGSSNTVRCD